MNAYPIPSTQLRLLILILLPLRNCSVTLPSFMTFKAIFHACKIRLCADVNPCCATAFCDPSQVILSDDLIQTSRK